ncbi:MAG TPA: amidohydrolase family protein [Gammaproteobacteria bacterium]|nr:amidohydrolase family protein [Gammaproteobacteria bacterium]
MISIIDTHPHVISPDTRKYPLSPLGGKQSTWSAEHALTHEALVAVMDEAGIAKAVVVQASTAYGYDNSYLADTVAAHPERFTGVFAVDVLAPDAIERIEYWRARNLAGLRLFTAGSTMEGQAGWLNDPRTHAMWRHAVDTDLPVCVQMRPPGLRQLAEVLARFPEATILIDHLARSTFDDGPPYAGADALWSLARFPNVNLKLTLRNIEAAAQGKSTLPAFLDKLRATYGAERIAWGSNFPAADRPLPELVARALEALAPLAERERNQIMSDTALRLYPALT